MNSEQFLKTYTFKIYSIFIKNQQFLIPFSNNQQQNVSKFLSCSVYSKEYGRTCVVLFYICKLATRTSNRQPETGSVESERCPKMNLVIPRLPHYMKGGCFSVKTLQTENRWSKASVSLCQLLGFPLVLDWKFSVGFTITLACSAYK